MPHLPATQLVTTRTQADANLPFSFIHSFLSMKLDSLLDARTRVSIATDSKATGKKKGAGKPSAYNEYMKVQLAKLKADNEKTGKKNDHKENFKKVAESWKTA
ncbi:hypothetical protein IAR55_002883 [Kwoniella newhampshirensis]|uniref:HMG box domain-containing protein n=1 Tax=Kwoniella newhampshirensis TaxID=1651941 RepID=A0AAW0YNX0_9TREE